MALGAFLSGLLLAETEFRREIEVTIEPFKGLLLGLFFVSVGAELDLSLAGRKPRGVLEDARRLHGAEGVSLIRWRGCSARPRRRRAMPRSCLASGGEFAFVLIGAAIASGVVDDELGRHRDRRGGDFDVRAADNRPVRGRFSGEAPARRHARGGADRAARGRRPSRHHRRLWPGRRADRRNARRPQDSRSSASTPTRAGRRRAGRRSPCLFRRRFAARSSCASAASKARARSSSP